MPIDPKNYDWLDGIGPLPRMIVEARKLLGTIEAEGPGNNRTILKWAEEVGGDVADFYTADSIPWCGLFMAVVARRAGKTPPRDPLWALNWGNFGDPAGQPLLGDVITFIRKTPDGRIAGHVGLYIGEDENSFHILGGNQTDQVCFERFARNRARDIRRTPYMVRPASAKPYIVRAVGGLSVREN